MLNNNIVSMTQSSSLELSKSSRLAHDISSHCCFNSKQMADHEMLQFLKQIYANLNLNFEKVVNLAQGYPKVATLIVEAQLAQNFDLETLSHNNLLNKLLWKKGEVQNQTHLKILQACSLFDVFSIEKNKKSPLSFIARLCDTHIDTVTQCLQIYVDRGLIYRHGHLAQITPKPLAVQLAAQWWSSASQEMLWELTEVLPNNIIETICNQIKHMGSHSDIDKITQMLYAPESVWVKPESILSDQGSKIFGAFVNVSPKPACAALYRTLSNMDSLQRKAIVGDTRRNLLSGLEKLCAETHHFTTATWCILLLASAENESWSNNATDRFTQLFRISLSGTKANPTSRFAFLEEAMNLHDDEIDIVLLQALEQAVSPLGGSRIATAGYQADDRSSVKEWRPNCQKEVCEYWQQALLLSLRLSKRGDTQREQILYYIGHSIRGFVHRGCVEMLDNTIRQIINENGPYWPAALTSIRNTFEYDVESLTEPTAKMLNNWMALLNDNEPDLFITATYPCKLGFNHLQSVAR